MSSSTDIQEVASKLQQLSLTKNGIALPMPQQLYAMGNVLFRIKGNDQHEGCRELLTAYRELIDSMPVEHFKKIFRLYHRGMSTLIIETRSSSSSLEKLRSAVQTMGGLLCIPKVCKLAYSKDWLSSLSSIYDIHILKDSSRIQKDEVLSLLSHLLVEGLLAADAKQQPESLEELLMSAIQTMEEESTDCLRDLQDWERRLEPSHGSLENVLKNLPFNEDTLHQREYIFNMLESARLREQTETTSILDVNQKPATKATKAKVVSPADEMERRIAQVKQIIPDLGEGFIETALSLYQGNVETTVSTLLNDPSQYPPNLQFLDRSLPRRKKDRAEDEERDAAEAKELVKARMALEAQQEQDRYKALLYVSAQEKEQMVVNEYNDDYDDQYDDIDVKLGDTDGGLYDFEQMKIYNKFAREGEAEDSFWEANRNTNRANDAKGNINNNTGGGQKQFRGPDKIKGGRIVGPDGKIVRKPNHKKNKNKQQAAKQQQQQGQQQGKTANGNSNNTNGNGNKKPAPNANNNNTNNNGNSGQNQKGKPKTKPKSNNRVNRQRDKKQKSQGTFGI
ncbi:unnamed protein product [Cylindrotheca closterium]|uniref:CUE domain-containing protein n=1 Tax=Cylindrotheca closterium TaxID=2856 RepID=A0AAD2FEW3_9STRA|nr:unnamed protein product [Cylindrotheca closterium]